MSRVRLGPWKVILVQVLLILAILIVTPVLYPLLFPPGPELTPLTHR
jgi:hypothetical protein